MVSDRFDEILQKWQKFKEKIHTTKDRKFGKFPEIFQLVAKTSKDV
jgi:hypothetical protein